MEEVIIISYLFIIFGIAFSVRKKKNTPEEEFLAGKSLSKTESIFSIIAGGIVII